MTGFLLVRPAENVDFRPGEDNLSAWTVSSLRDRVKVDSLVQFFTEALSSENPQEQFESVAHRAKEVFSLNASSKHMVGRDLGRF